MARERHTPDEIVAKLRQVDGLVAQGQAVAEAIRAVATEVEEVVDLVVGGEEALGVPGRLVALHLPLPPSRGLVGVFSSVVQGRRREEFAIGGGV